MLGIGTESDVALKGTFIEVPWRLVETTSGDYSWQDFDAKIAASAGNVLVRLEVNSICHAPDWVTIPYLDNKSLQFWKPEYVSQLTNFINAFGARYRAEDKIVGVHLGIADGEYYESGTQSGCPPNDKFDVLVNGFGRQGWGEFWLDESLGEETKSRQNGLTDVLLQSSVEDIIDMYVDAFGPYAYKLAMVNLDSFGTAADFEAKMPGIVNYALSKGIGNRGGEIEAWMRYTDNFYGVDLVDTPSPDGSCKMIFDESFADSLSLSGRYWGMRTNSMAQNHG